MHQRSLKLPSLVDSIEDNVYHAAFHRFSAGCRPSSFELAINDSTFSRLLKARATQMLRELDRNKRFGRGE